MAPWAPNATNSTNSSGGGSASSGGFVLTPIVFSSSSCASPTPSASPTQLVVSAPASSSSEALLSPGAIAGIAIGGAVVLALAVVLTLLLCANRGQGKVLPDDEAATPGSPGGLVIDTHGTGDITYVTQVKTPAPTTLQFVELREPRRGSYCDLPPVSHDSSKEGDPLPLAPLQQPDSSAAAGNVAAAPHLASPTRAPAQSV